MVHLIILIISSRLPCPTVSYELKYAQDLDFARARVAGASTRNGKDLHAGQVSGGSWVYE
jgi:hypothetical protein